METVVSRYVVTNLICVLLFRVSLTVNLRQALKAEDERQVSVLITTVDNKIISATAKELTGDEATALIERLSKFVIIDPRRLPVVMDWVRELVLAHASFISSQSSMKARLVPILDLLKLRVAHNAELNQMRQTIDAVLKHTPSGVDTPTNSFSQEPALKWVSES